MMKELPLEIQEREDAFLKETLAYLAGIIDGEGYVGITKEVQSGSPHPHYIPQIHVKMTHPAPILLLRETFGGRLYDQGQVKESGKQLFTWTLTGFRVAPCLQALFPYLRVKEEQAKLVLQFLQLRRAAKGVRIVTWRGFGSYPAFYHGEFGKLHSQMKELNR